MPDAELPGKRIHLDLEPTDRTRDEEVDRVLALGATQVADMRNADGSGWVVLADPEGNLFCVLRSAAEREPWADHAPESSPRRPESATQPRAPKHSCTRCRTSGRHRAAARSSGVDPTTTAASSRAAEQPLVQLALPQRRQQLAVRPQHAVPGVVEEKDAGRPPPSSPSGYRAPSSSRRW